MKRVSFAFLTLAFYIIIVICSCSKRANEKEIASPATSITDKTKLNSLFAPFRTTPQTFVVTAGISQMVIGAKGTKLRFNPGSFKDENGNVITGGNINLELIEMYKPGNMIANRATTMSNGNFLASGGQIYLKVSMSGKNIEAGTYGISYANAESGNIMNLYTGNTANEDSVVTWGNPLASLGTFCVNGTFDTTGTGVTGDLYYKFDSCTKFEWINCDRLYSNPAPKTKIYLTMNDTTFNATNTQVYMVIPSINSVACMSFYDATLRRFQFNNYYTVPEGITVSFIAMAVKNGSYYYFESPNQEVTTNMVIDASSVSTQSIDFIKSRLSSF
jgi:hypothetical protein